MSIADCNWKHITGIYLFNTRPPLFVVLRTKAVVLMFRDYSHVSWALLGPLGLLGILLLVCLSAWRSMYVRERLHFYIKCRFVKRHVTRSKRSSIYVLIAY